MHAYACSFKFLVSTDSMIKHVHWNKTCASWIGLRKLDQKLVWFINNTALNYTNFAKDLKEDYSFFYVSILYIIMPLNIEFNL